MMGEGVDNSQIADNSTVVNQGNNNNQNANNGDNSFYGAGNGLVGNSQVNQVEAPDVSFYDAEK